MDEHLETSWCPVCDKLIQPRRYQVVLSQDGTQTPANVASSDQPTQPPLHQQPPAAPAAASKPPAHPAAPAPRNPSPTGSARNAAAAARGRRPTRAGYGLVHGTGRVKPGGGLRRDSDDAGRATRSALMLPPPPPPSPASVRPATFPPKVRTLIDQDQTPLYCSEKCRQLDAQRRACMHNSRVVIASRDLSNTSALNDSPASFTASDKLLPPQPPSTRRSSDSSNTTESSSIFDKASVRSSLPDLDEIESPLRRRSGTKDLPRSASELIKEELLGWADKQPKAPYGERQERIPPGWRPHESQWRKKVYGDFDPKPRPQMPAREPTPPASPPRPVDPAHLSPFDRLPTLATMSAPDPQAATKELLSKMKFARTPSTTALPASSSSASLVSRSRASASSFMSPPTLTTSLSYRSSSSRQSRSSDGRRSRRGSNEHCDSDSPSDSEEEYIQANIKRSSMPVVGRSDALSRALEAKAREELKEQYAAEQLAQLDRDCEETRQLRARGITPESLEDRIRLQGPILGRRAAGVSSVPAQHSWSFEDLPSHIPLYPMPGMPKPRVERRVERVRDDATGEVREVQVEVTVPPSPPKRLFLFGGASSAPRRHSALALSPA
ncbi:hypothetical protein AURDEDRAFT_184628 [Auricularia subglabra TFB-10046 SS5]|nr:hypothetical protein AURDEDRAFT_184628 [Auricularia subglabra TFB-10046 SS5]